MHRSDDPVALMAVSFSMSTPSPSGRSALILIPALLASLSMLGPFSIDTPLPAFKEMAGALSVTSAEMQYVISAYMLAFALMSPFHGPISDALGRKPVMITGVALYVLASLGCVLSTSLEMLPSSGLSGLERGRWGDRVAHGDPRPLRRRRRPTPDEQSDADLQRGPPRSHRSSAAGCSPSATGG
jgi:hypothetical protein